MARPPIGDVISRHADALLALPGVTIVFEGKLDDGDVCITIGVVDASAPGAGAIPTTIEGYRVVVKETGAVGPRESVR